ncbi:hypothetical protein CEXT_239571 [Caerostris extrusa]|uniref:Uncharacterized protein n=1 Tax=Caerostris extrusa TaxID=172846 RepID=A0AAV4UMF4_CAEEX|nr:hypothetical protein CEXT_239571 [Caerostris extrusa]
MVTTKISTRKGGNNHRNTTTTTHTHFVVVVNRSQQTPLFHVPPLSTLATSEEPLNLHPKEAFGLGFMHGIKDPNRTPSPSTQSEKMFL